MAFDGITTKSISYELQYSILGGKINKIFEPNKNEVLLSIYANGKNYALNICIDSNLYRIHLTTNAKPNPLNAPNFCMLLRKHLIGYKIKAISSNDNLERIIKIELEGYNELNDLTTKYLMVELMGKHSNIILLNDKFFIIDSLRHLDTLSNSYRDILPAHEYTYPENVKNNFYTIKSAEEFCNLVLTNNVTNLTNFLVGYFTGFSKPFIKNIIIKQNIRNTDFSKDDILKMYEYLSKILNNLDSNHVSLTKYSNEKGKLDYVIDLETKTSNLDINFYIDDFYYNKEANNNYVSYRNNLLKLISHILKKYSLRLESINNKLKECENKDLYKLYGELITANLYKFSKDYNSDKVELENYYDNNTILTIPLDNTISIANNAKKYFKKYNKLKNALEIVTLQKKETEEELQYIESIIYELEYAKNIQEVNEIYNEISENPIFKDYIQSNNKTNTKKDANISTPREYHIDGFTVLVGKNNKQNDYLTTKLASPNDIWFHTKDIHGSHVILKNPSENISNDTLIKCAKLAAYYSKGRLSSNVPVDYCFVKYVKKPNGSKPGMVIYTNNKTLNVTPYISD
ncbi:fibronectin-binding A domain protein [Clostridium sp. CAG:354]|jgi:predicted ribosome quality control (RQC) complex YloA/Tae2 family protein|nr:NFACT family protein [Clostridium sp.]MBS5864561.1 NFACT family protein [Clostridium sp.]MEE0268821.1 NFACT RNA binding domain-containing protein [Clostridia bacterium]CDE10585.1 fibronectin-binding A domain protein [Clostridium sp. CAG:354]